MMMSRVQDRSEGQVGGEPRGPEKLEEEASKQPAQVLGVDGGRLQAGEAALSRVMLKMLWRQGRMPWQRWTGKQFSTRC